MAGISTGSVDTSTAGVVDPSTGDVVDTPINPDTPVTSPKPPASHARAGPRRAGEPVRARSVLVAAAATGTWAGIVSAAPVLVVVLLGWFGSTTVPSGTAVRFAVTSWLLGHGVPFDAAHGRVGLVPLAVTALVVWRLVRAGAHTARAVAATPRDIPSVLGALALSYGTLGGIAATAASTAAFTVSPLRAFLTTGVVAGLAGLPGALMETRAVNRWWPAWPAPVRESLRDGAVVTLGILAAGAALAGVATAVAYQDAVELYRDYEVGVGGGAGIAVVGLIYSPNLAIWAASYLLGPGFRFGEDTAVTVFDVSLGPLPAVPALAGLPTGPAPEAVAVLLVVPVLIGMAIGVSTTRRSPQSRWPAVVLTSASTGAVTGASLAVLSLLASGSLGSGRLAQIGPTWWLVGALGLAVVGVGVLLSATATRLVLFRR